MLDSSNDTNRFLDLLKGNDTNLKLVADADYKQPDYELLPLKLIPNNDDNYFINTKRKKKKRIDEHEKRTSVQDEAILTGLQTVIDLCGLLDRYDVYNGNKFEKPGSGANTGPKSRLSPLLEKDREQFADKNLSTFHAVIANLDQENRSSSRYSSPLRSHVSVSPTDSNNNRKSLKSADGSGVVQGDDCLDKDKNAFGSTLKCSLLYPARVDPRGSRKPPKRGQPIGRLPFFGAYDEDDLPECCRTPGSDTGKKLIHKDNKKKKVKKKDKKKMKGRPVEAEPIEVGPKNECCVPDCCRNPLDLHRIKRETELLCKPDCCLHPEDRTRRTHELKALDKPECCLSPEQRHRKSIMKDSCLTPEEKCERDLMERKLCCLTKEERKKRKKAHKLQRKKSKENKGKTGGSSSSGVCANISNPDNRCLTFEETQRQQYSPHLQQKTYPNMHGPETPNPNPEPHGAYPNTESHWEYSNLGPYREYPSAGIYGRYPNHPEQVGESSHPAEFRGHPYDTRPNALVYYRPVMYEERHPRMIEDLNDVTTAPTNQEHRWNEDRHQDEMRRSNPELKWKEDRRRDETRKSSDPYRPPQPPPEDPTILSRPSLEDQRARRPALQEDVHPVQGPCAKHKQWYCNRRECCLTLEEMAEKRICQKHGAYECDKAECCIPPHPRKEKEPKRRKQSLDDCCALLEDAPKETKTKPLKEIKEAKRIRSTPYCCLTPAQKQTIEHSKCDKSTLEDYYLTPAELEARRRERTPDCCLSEEEVRLKKRERKEGRKQRRAERRMEDREWRENERRVKRARRSARKQKEEEANERKLVAKRAARSSSSPTSSRSSCCLSRARKEKREERRAQEKSWCCLAPREKKKTYELDDSCFTEEERASRKRERLIEALLRQQMEMENKKGRTEFRLIRKPGSEKYVLAEVEQPRLKSKSANKNVCTEKNGANICVPCTGDKSRVDKFICTENDGKLLPQKAAIDEIVCTERDGAITCVGSSPNPKNDKIVCTEKDGKIVCYPSSAENEVECSPSLKSKTDRYICTENDGKLVCQNISNEIPCKSSAKQQTFGSLIPTSTADKTISTETKGLCDREIQTPLSPKPRTDLQVVCYAPSNDKETECSTLSSSRRKDEKQKKKERKKNDKRKKNELEEKSVASSTTSCADVCSKQSKPSTPQISNLSVSCNPAVNIPPVHVTCSECETLHELMKQLAEQHKECECNFLQEIERELWKLKRKEKAGRIDPCVNKGVDSSISPCAILQKGVCLESCPEEGQTSRLPSKSMSTSEIEETLPDSRESGERRRRSHSGVSPKPSSEADRASKIFLGLPCGKESMVRKTVIDCRKSRMSIPVVQPVIGICTEGICTGDHSERAIGVMYAQVKITEFPKYLTYEIMRATPKKPQYMSSLIEQLFVTKKPCESICRKRHHSKSRSKSHPKGDGSHNSSKSSLGQRESGFVEEFPTEVSKKASPTCPNRNRVNFSNEVLVRTQCDETKSSCGPCRRKKRKGCKDATKCSSECALSEKCKNMRSDLRKTKSKER